MKKLAFVLLVGLLIPFSFILADSGAGDCPMSGKFIMGGGTGWTMGLISLVYFVLVSFIFSLIFWLTHKWIVKKK
jgi:hypothetical protein